MNLDEFSSALEDLQKAWEYVQEHMQSIADIIMDALEELDVHIDKDLPKPPRSCNIVAANLDQTTLWRLDRTPWYTSGFQ